MDKNGLQKWSGSISTNRAAGSRESRFRWLRRYRQTKLAGLFFLFLVIFFWWVPAVYTLQENFPPFEELNRSEGILSFTGDVERHRYFTILTDENGIKHKFSCRVSFGGDSHSCGTRDYSGKRAVIWWHPLHLHPLQKIQHAVQIEVDGKIVRSYDRALGKFARLKTKDPWWAAGVTVCFSIMLIVIFQIERKFHGQNNN